MSYTYEQWKYEQPVIERLQDELNRLINNYRSCNKAVEALEMVKFWAIEESVTTQDAPENWISDVKMYVDSVNKK